MRNITVLYDGTNYTRAWLQPLVWARTEFEEEGFNIFFFGRENFTERGVYEEIKIPIDKLENLDIVLCAFHDSGAFGNPELQIEQLIKLKSKAKYIVWLDVEDSTGGCKFNLLPYVDKYLKGQLLKDMDMYQKPYFAGRVWCDYYHKYMGIEDDKYSMEYFGIEDKTHINKIGLSWNFGLGKMVYETDFFKASKDRTYDLYYRGTTFDSITHYQRNLVIEKLKKITDLRMVNPEEYVSKKKYIEEIRNSRCMISPFGWGELCLRDFEAFTVGAALIKPVVNHMVTYPDCFKEYETYIPLKWNFDNFYEVLELIKNEDYTFYIAQNGQNRYIKYARSKHARILFVKHLLKQMF
ncbi:hypothetical protein [Butyrivibrio sp. NC3005]|uniref:hypothetical protein n=1 Tax=Butyrivibrio sp. NC3005 TaxID=1280685 RepID=UPI00041D3504|nr:hypothetical protein [Butyrivibrio sp. NC3005]